MLCDTGAACSYISRAFYESHLASMTPLVKQRKPQKLVSAGGTGLTTIGNVKTNIKLGGCSLPIEFFVVDNLTQDVILSAEFFKCMGVLIDYKRKCLSLYNESINMRGGSHRMHWKYNYMPRLYHKAFVHELGLQSQFPFCVLAIPPGFPRLSKSYQGCA